ncbi:MULTISPECIES: hypothetical protein [Helcococcus]|uniref:Uncharacterized protein n=1 Tax=Helcococcus bovis TaxID=3153252 RepID=A0ABW9F503_9FIRM
MPNTKTHLRELSVALTIGMLKNNIDFSLSDLYDGNFFYSKALEVISNDNLHLAQRIQEFETFSYDNKQIISNGYQLGVAIFNHPHFIFKKSDNIMWLGSDTSKEDPIDILIGKYGFSLKEDSFILENMGLYKLINLFTGSNYKHVHIFKQFSPQEFNEWFNTTWNILVEYLVLNKIWTYDDSQRYKTSIRLNGDKVHFNYSLRDGSKSINKFLDKNSDYSDFEKNTISLIREHAFSKFINKVASKEDEYNNTKRECALIATQNLSSYLMDNLKYEETLARFLRIHEKEYYYAKTTSRGVEIYKVPSRDK